MFTEIVNPRFKLAIGVCSETPFERNRKDISEIIHNMVNLVVVLGVVGNILSVVGVVICNKYITEKDGYNFMVFLSALHFVATYIVT